MGGNGNNSRWRETMLPGGGGSGEPLGDAAAPPEQQPTSKHYFFCLRRSVLSSRVFLCSLEAKASFANSWPMKLLREGAMHKFPRVGSDPRNKNASSSWVEDLAPRIRSFHLYCVICIDRAKISMLASSPMFNWSYTAAV